ncbi:hypothetical protein HID58_096324 [Brassica napus]|uniref:Rab-GAP TBC domain-containing protein n=1 Tax=Brassica napus TaxID=3708 RepID=A0ABQ7X2Z0_BRANA|nr:hypothetical protein HID58_096324 [Brassica napus]
MGECLAVSFLKAYGAGIVPLVGSGKFVAMAIVAEDGQPLEESSAENQESLVKTAVTDKRVLQWMLNGSLSMLYESENNQARLWDVLAIFAWLNPDIGYVQGMDDICSPMIILLEDEADAFWCFERAMGRVRENTSMGVQTQLVGRCILLYTTKDLDGGEFLFAIRMLMVLSRKEFSFLDAFYLWEMMWAMEYNTNKFASYKKTENGTKQDPRFTEAVCNTTARLWFLLWRVFLKQRTKNKRLLKEAKGLDDVVQVSLYAKIPHEKLSSLVCFWLQILGGKACKEALKIHEKFLRKVTTLLLIKSRGR